MTTKRMLALQTEVILVNDRIKTIVATLRNKRLPSKMRKSLGKELLEKQKLLSRITMEIAFKQP